MGERYENKDPPVVGEYPSTKFRFTCQASSHSASLDVPAKICN